MWPIIATQSLWWMRGAGGGRGESSVEARLTGLLADILPAGAAGARRVPPRRAVLAHLLYYARRLLALPLPVATQGQVTYTLVLYVPCKNRRKRKASRIVWKNI